MNLARLALVPLWAAAFWGSLQVHRMDLHLGHGLCGPWGCGPPLEAAIGFHLFWITILLPATIGVGLYLSNSKSRDVGRILLLVAVVMTLGIVGYDVITHAIQSRTIGYVFRRGLLTLVTTIDVPMMQLVAAGALLRYYFGRKTPTEARPDEDPLKAHGQMASGA